MRLHMRLHRMLKTTLELSFKFPALLILLAIGSSAQAQSDFRTSVRWYDLNSSKREALNFQGQYKASPIAVEEARRDLYSLLQASGLAIHPQASLEHQRTYLTGDGFVLRFYLSYKGVPVAGNTLVASYGNSGSLESVTHDLPGLELAQVEDSILQDQAYEKVKEAAGSVFRRLGLQIPPVLKEAYLVVVKNKKSERVLAWRMKVSNFFFDVDASGESAGELINVSRAIQSSDIDLLYNGLPGFLSAYTDQINGTTIYRNGSLTREGQIFSMINPNMVKEQMSTTAVLFQETLDLFLSVFNQNSYDGLGKKVLVVFQGDMSGNAFWNGNYFGMGVDSAEAKGLSQAPDVVAHEFTHAVISHSSDLFYSKQSGALNESLADIFGEFIQVRSKRLKDPVKDAWKIGETASFANVTKPLRDMKEPALSMSPQPAHMDDLKSDAFKQYDENCVPSPFNDNCGVHVLSGIPNRAFVSVVESIGWDKAMSIYFKVMKHRLHPASDFKNFRAQIIDECLRQGLEPNCGSVALAFDLVGVK